MNNDTILYSRSLREIKERYAMLKADIERDYATRQAKLTAELDLERNTLHYLNQSMRASGADIDQVKQKLDQTAERIRELSQQKVELDYRRKCDMSDLRLRRHAELSQLDSRLAQAQQEGGEL